jgi:hypothetical protein
MGAWISAASKLRFLRAASDVVLVDTNILAYLMLEGDRTPDVQRLYERDHDWHSEDPIDAESKQRRASSGAPSGV